MKFQEPPLTFRIGDRTLGPGAPCYLIAELGVNHNGSLDTAIQLVERAKWAGADAVKFQTFRVEELVTRSSPKARYQMTEEGGLETQWEMLKRLELSVESHVVIQNYCKAIGIDFLSSAFDCSSVDFLDALGVPTFKIPSGEITHGNLLEHIAKKGKPVILSTGMSTLEEVDRAVLKFTGLPLVLLQCTSAYPTPCREVNLRAMQTMADRYQLPVGLSDHSEGILVALAAAAREACVLEKHFTLDRALPGPDHRASLIPSEFKTLVEGVRTIEHALGNRDKQVTESEIEIRAMARRSLVAATDLKRGTVLTSAMILVRRPGKGIPPDRLWELTGQLTPTDIRAGEPFPEEWLK